MNLKTIYCFIFTLASLTPFFIPLALQLHISSSCFPNILLLNLCPCIFRLLFPSVSPSLPPLLSFPFKSSTLILLFICFLSSAEAPGQDFVTLDYRLRYYPSITYAVIGSAVIFVLVVALLALVLHHQRKRSVLLPRGVRGSSHHHHHHQPLLLSRLVILDRGHVHPGGPSVSPGSPTAAGQYSSTPQALQLLSGTLYPSGLSVDSPPSYSQAVLDVR